MTVHRSAGDYIEEEARQLLKEIWGHQEKMSQASGHVIEFDKAKEDYFEKCFSRFVLEFRSAHTVAV